MRLASDEKRGSTTLVVPEDRTVDLPVAISTRPSSVLEREPPREYTRVPCESRLGFPPPAATRNGVAVSSSRLNENGTAQMPAFNPSRSDRSKSKCPVSE